MEHTPHKLAVLILPGSTMLTVASVLDPLRAANRLSGQKPYEWKLYSPTGRTAELSGAVSLDIDTEFAELEPADTLIIIASFDHERHTTKALISNLLKQAPNFTRLCCVEAGTWVLAKTGLLNRKSATTHWEDIEDLQSTFPKIDVTRHRNTIDGKYWSCGGASPAIDMMLNLIRQTSSAALALNVASVFIYDETHAPTDNQPNISIGKLGLKEPRLATAIKHMETHIEAPLQMKRIAKQASLSIKMLELLFAKHLATTPGRYYRHLRLQAALKLVQDTNISLQEISIRTGFSSLSSFSRAFKAHYQKTPSALRSAI